MQALSGHHDFDSAYVIPDWPWGYKLKCETRFWIEHRENTGWRFVKQTKNPKTDKWCAPKKGVYQSLILMYLDDENKIQHGSLSKYPWEEHVETFIILYGPYCKLPFMDEIMYKHFKYLVTIHSLKDCLARNSAESKGDSKLLEDAEFHSVWSDGEDIVTNCKFCHTDGSVEEIEISKSTPPNDVILEQEYIVLKNGDQLDICTNCHEFVLQNIRPGQIKVCPACEF